MAGIASFTTKDNMMRVVFLIRTIGEGTDNEEEEAITRMINALEEKGPFKILTVGRAYYADNGEQIDPP